MEIEAASVRDRLLDAAEAIVGRDGVGNLTLEAVAREAGLSKGGLLYHFHSKSSLIIAIVERLAGRSEADHGRAVEQDPVKAGAFTRAYVATRANRFESGESHRFHTALLAAAATDQEYLDPIRKRCVEWQGRLEKDGIDPATATIVRLAMDGMCLGAIFGMPVPTGEKRRLVIEKLIEMTKSE